MTVIGQIVRFMDNHTRLSWYSRYSAFHNSYTNSGSRTRFNTLQTVIWVLGTAFSQILPGYLGWQPRRIILGNTVSTSNLLLALSALLAVSTIFAIGPGVYYLRNKPFQFEPKWFPITTRSEPLRDAHDDKLRLSNDPILIVVYFDIVGKIDGYNFKFISSSDEIEFDLWSELNISQEPYSDGSGVYSTSPVENDSIFNIYEVEKRSQFRGAPLQKIQIMSIPKEFDDTYETEITDKDAKTHGHEILEVTVTE